MIGKKRILITGSDGQLGKKIKFFKKNHRQYELFLRVKMILILLIIIFCSNTSTTQKLII